MSRASLPLSQARAGPAPCWPGLTCPERRVLFPVIRGKGAANRCPPAFSLHGFALFSVWLSIFHFCCQVWLWPEELSKFTSAHTLTVPCSPYTSSANLPGARRTARRLRGPGRPRLSTSFQVMFLCNPSCSSAQLTGPRPGPTAQRSRPVPRPVPRLLGTASAAPAGPGLCCPGPSHPTPLSSPPPPEAVSAAR